MIKNHKRKRKMGFRTLTFKLAAYNKNVRLLPIGANCSKILSSDGTYWVKMFNFVVKLKYHV